MRVSRSAAAFVIAFLALAPGALPAQSDTAAASEPDTPSPSPAPTERAPAAETLDCPDAAGTETQADGKAGTYMIGTGADVFLGAFQWKPSLASDALNLRMAYDGEFFDSATSVTAMNDGAFATHNAFELGHYFLIDEAWARISHRGLALSGGKAAAVDVLDSPYSVFLSSEPIPAVFTEFSWDSPHFSYRTRWIQLNSNSIMAYNGTEGGMPIIDRGMNFKTYAVELGDLRFGFEDCIVYLGRSFDAEAFLSPVPMFVIEMVNTSGGRPGQEEGNTNSLLGAFVEYKRPEWDVGGQLLMDDVNAGFLAPVLGWAIPSLKDIRNLSKFAWTIGGNWRSPYGLFSFNHGGATAHTFQATYSESTYAGDASVPDYSTLPYDYSYYPVTEYERDGSMQPLPYVKNYIGYKYGENNLAFRFAYANEAFPREPWAFGYSAALEYVVSGTKSPANPWAEHESWWEIDEGAVELLSEDVLEHRLVLSGAAAKTWKGWTFTASAELGYAWNRLALVEASAGEAKMWKPEAGVGAGIFGLRLGASYRWTFRDAKKERNDETEK